MTKYDFLGRWVGHLAPADREFFESDLDEMVGEERGDEKMNAEEYAD